MLRKLGYIGFLLLSCAACFFLGAYLSLDKTALVQQTEESKKLQAKISEYIQCNQKTSAIWEQARGFEALSAKTETLNRLIDADRLGISLDTTIRDQGSSFRKALTSAEPLLSSSKDQNAQVLLRQAAELRETLDRRYPLK